jgi:hypothetical protein
MMNMRGRYPSGPEYVDGWEASQPAKERLKGVLETLGGNARVQEVCQRLKISEPRFHQLREQVIDASLASLEPRRPGRRRRSDSPLEQQVRDLEKQVADLKVQLHVAQVREEIRLVLPGVVKKAPQTPDNAADNGRDQVPDQEQSNRPHQADQRPNEGQDQGADTASDQGADQGQEKKTRRRRPPARARAPTSRKPT